MKKRSKVRSTVRRHLTLPTSIGIHHKNLKLAGLDKPLAEQLLVSNQLRRIRRMRGAIDDPLSIRRDRGLCIVAGGRGQALHFLPVETNGIDVIVIERPAIRAVSLRLWWTVRS